MWEGNSSKQTLEWEDIPKAKQMSTIRGKV